MNEEEDNLPVAGSSAHLESYLSDATLPKDRAQEETSRVNIHVRSYRRLNCDPDGISAKAALDGIVEAGILADDSAKQVACFSSEVITGCGKDEEATLIIIEGEDL